MIFVFSSQGNIYSMMTLKLKKKLSYTDFMVITLMADIQKCLF